MDLGPLLGLGLLWLVANAIRKGGAKPPPRPGGPSGPTSTTRPGTREARPSTGPLPPMPARPDATQREGSALERLLQDLGRTLEEARTTGEPKGRMDAPAKAPASPEPPARSKPARDKVRASRTGSTRTAAGSRDAPTRGERVEVDQDDEAERVVQQRLDQVAARGGPLGEADHQRFDQRIRQEPADHTAVQPRDPAIDRLRQAIVWREILGPPVSLRDDPGP